MTARRADFLLVTLLAFIFIVLYLPVWSSEYLYTDEAVQLWFYGKEPGFEMFGTQGRYITEKLFALLFGSIQQVKQVMYTRFFSFSGWFATLPIFYFGIKKILVKEGLPGSLAFLTVLFIICSPTVSISIAWASCLELFLANVCGFLSGYFFYQGIHTVQDRKAIGVMSISIAVFFGIISLFTYQNGSGFFFLPFIIHAVSPSRKLRTLWLGISGYLLICGLYFILFKYSIHAAGLAASSRTSLFIAPWGKLWFFFTRPLSSAFHFTYLFNEKDIAGYIIYFFLFGTWLVLAFLRLKGTAMQHRLKYIALVVVLLVFSYMPSLLVRENYASNRTLLALDTCVWFITAEMVLYYLKSKNEKQVFSGLIVFLFSINAFYNLTRLFLRPINYEYVQLRRYVEQHVTPAVHTIYFIRPQEDFFVKQYGITRSWDEFGVPSTFFGWVPEYFVRQIIYEKTGDRNQAKKIIIKDSPTRQALDSIAQTNSATVLIVQAEALIKTDK